MAPVYKLGEPLFVPYYKFGNEYRACMTANGNALRTYKSLAMCRRYNPKAKIVVYAPEVLDE